MTKSKEFETHFEQFPLAIVKKIAEEDIPDDRSERSRRDRRTSCKKSGRRATAYSEETLPPSRQRIRWADNSLVVGVQPLAILGSQLRASLCWHSTSLD